MADNSTDVNLPYWYERGDIVYGQATILLFCSIIAFFCLINALFLVRHTKKGRSSMPRHRWYRWPTAFGRFISMRELRLYKWTIGTYANILAAIGLLAFFGAYCFLQRPYYWQKAFDYADLASPPPLANRAAWMSLACIPFVAVLASKANPISLATGISYEKLQLYHRFCAWAMFTLALVHTIPFIIRDTQDGNISFQWEHKKTYWTGVAALAPAFVLMLGSITALRNRFYETFKFVHFLTAIIFTGACFWHVWFATRSHVYFWVLIGVYGASLMVRYGIYFIRNGFKHKALVTLLPDSTISISIPTKLKWQPGAHFFFRFPLGNLHTITAHPFTVSSIPSQGFIEVCARVRDGTTAQLARKAATEDWTVSVTLDGPYGGLSTGLESYDRVLLCGGGTGGSFVVAILKDLLEKSANNNSANKVIELIWATKTEASMEWYHAALEVAINTPHHLDLRISVHVTAYVALPLPAIDTTALTQRVSVLPTYQHHKRQISGASEASVDTIIAEYERGWEHRDSYRPGYRSVYIPESAPTTPMSEKAMIPELGYSQNSRGSYRNSYGPNAKRISRLPSPRSLFIRQNSEAALNKAFYKEDLDLTLKMPEPAFRQKEADMEKGRLEPIRVSFHPSVTAGSPISPTTPASAATTKSFYPNRIEVNYGRPKLADALARHIVHRGTVAVAACGPRAFTQQVSTAAASAQMLILRREVACTDLFFHEEQYGW